MEFKEALATVCLNRASDEEISSPFPLYSRLCDLCSSSYGGKEKILLFYQIDLRLGVIKFLLKGKGDLYSRHSEVADLISEEKLRSLLDTVKKILDDPRGTLSSYTAPKPALTKAPTPVKAAVKKQGKHAVAQRATPTASLRNCAMVTPAPKSKSQRVASPRFNTHNYSSDFWYGVLGASVITLIALFALALIFSWSWTFWQWYIGLVGGALVGVIAFAIPFMGDPKSSYLAALITLCVAQVISFVFCAVFGADYKIIFGCVGVIFMAVGGLLAITANDEPDAKHLSIPLGCTIPLSLIFMIIGITWF